jgi:hypothetical protein
MVNDEFDPSEGETLISATRLRLRKHAPFLLPWLYSLKYGLRNK